MTHPSNPFHNEAKENPLPTPPYVAMLVQPYTFILIFLIFLVF